MVLNIRGFFPGRATLNASIYTFPSCCYKHSLLVGYDCMKSVLIWSFFGPYYPAFGLNTGIYGPDKLRIRTLLTQCVFLIIPLYNNILVPILIRQLFYLLRSRFATTSNRSNSRSQLVFRMRSSSGENQNNTIVSTLQLPFVNLNLTNEFLRRKKPRIHHYRFFLRNFIQICRDGKNSGIFAFNCYGQQINPSSQGKYFL